MFEHRKKNISSLSSLYFYIYAIKIYEILK